MGIWSNEPFANDAAYDWAQELVESDNLSSIDAAIDRVLKGSGDFSETYHACEAIAAIEVLVILLGHETDSDNIMEELDRWLKRGPQPPSPALINKAKLCIDLIMSPNSALLKFWNGTEGGIEWKSNMRNLAIKLSTN